MLSELSVTREGIVLRDHRIVIPKSLRKRVVAHGGHQGKVESFMKKLRKVPKTAKISGMDEQDLSVSE